MKPKRRLTIPAMSIPLWWPDMPKNLRSWLPSRGNVLFTTTMILMLVWAQTAGAFPSLDTSATSTGTIAYQGRLADSGGNPLTTTVNMTFRLYNASTGGSPLWSEDWTGPNGVQVSDGLFNVMLGSLTAIPQSVISGNPTLFLGITAGTDDEMAPRVQLGSVPFAVQALTVPNGSVTTSKLADKSVTQAKLGTDVSLVPPDGSITTAKLADQSVTAQKVQTNQVFFSTSFDFFDSGMTSVNQADWVFIPTTRHLIPLVKPVGVKVYCRLAVAMRAQSGSSLQVKFSDMPDVMVSTSNTTWGDGIDSGWVDVTQIVQGTSSSIWNELLVKGNGELSRGGLQCAYGP
ncbi:MAG: hypothetical protein WAU10_09820 [Caldilineaceae bacterium]